MLTDFLPGVLSPLNPHVNDAELFGNGILTMAQQQQCSRADSLARQAQEVMLLSEEQVVPLEQQIPYETGPPPPHSIPHAPSPCRVSFQVSAKPVAPWASRHHRCAVGRGMVSWGPRSGEASPIISFNFPF